jgi:hypothetical protein
MTTQRTIPLGSKVRDRVTGFEGIATTRSSHISGCDTYWVTPGLTKDGKPGDIQSFDVNRLDVLKAPAVQVHADTEVSGTISAG